MVKINKEFKGGDFMLLEYYLSGKTIYWKSSYGLQKIPAYVDPISIWRVSEPTYNFVVVL